MKMSKNAGGFRTSELKIKTNRQSSFSEGEFCVQRIQKFYRFYNNSPQGISN